MVSTYEWDMTIIISRVAIVNSFLRNQALKTRNNFRSYQEEPTFRVSFLSEILPTVAANLPTVGTPFSHRECGGVLAH
jgi:serine/threonine protein kinase HipA of HipAB toxin-antitoxin module